MALPNSAAGAEFFPARTDIYVPPGVVGTDSYSFEVNSFVVRRGDSVAVVDTLMRPDHCQLILDALARADASATDISWIVLTHHHPDHTGDSPSSRVGHRRHRFCAAQAILPPLKLRPEWQLRPLGRARRLWASKSSQRRAAHPAICVCLTRLRRRCC
jgi:glyoxylase-like metal-dependent hydrolase (beta-lactamase superfamily II)